MNIKNERNSTPRTPAPAGSHFGRCIYIIDLGTQTGTIQGKPVSKKEIITGFELVHTNHVFIEGQQPMPFVVSKIYTASMNEKATLFKDLRSWLGRAITPQEQEVGYPMEERIGKDCMVTVVHAANKTDASIVYANISGLSGVPQGQQVPPARTPMVYFSIGMQNQFEIFKKTPGWIQKKIAASPEFREQCGRYNVNADTLMAEATEEWKRANNIQPQGQQQPPAGNYQQPQQQWQQPQQQQPAQGWQQQPAPQQWQQQPPQPNVQYPAQNQQFNPPAPGYGQPPYPQQQQQQPGYPPQQPAYQQPQQQWQQPQQQQPPVQQAVPPQDNWNPADINTQPGFPEPF